MKRVDVLITHEHLIEINELHKHNVVGITFYDVKGRGIMRRVPEFSAGTKIEVVVADNLVKPVVDDILNMLRKGSFASGKIFVSDIIEAYNIETNETGDAAL